jgi:flagellar M-ring protein FliF
MADAPSKSQNPALQVLKQTKELWDKQPKGRRTLAVLIVLGVLGFVGITTVMKKVENWTPVAEGMSPGDTQNVYSALIARGLNARLRDGRVEVEDGDLPQAKAIAAVSAGATGLSSMSEQFDHSTIGRTEFEQQVAFKRALQGELSRSIISLAQVSSANVQIAFGRKAAIKDMESPATASVTLVLRPGQQLTPDQISGIRAMVAASVDNLDASKVVVIGPRGPLDGTEKAGANNQGDLESRIAEKTRSMLEKIVGIGHVSVVATADIDTSKVNSIEHTFDKDRAVIRSQARTVDGSNPSPTQSSVGGVAGAQGNLAGSSAPTGGGSGSAVGSGHLTESTNYEISDKTIQTEMPEQKIKKLHVAVLVDENKDKAGKSIVRTKQELDQVTALTRQTAGIDDARGDTLEVTSVAFAPIEVATDPEPPKSLLPVPLPIAIGVGAGALVLIVLVVVLLKGRGKKGKTQALVLNRGRLAFPTPVAELERVLDGEPANTTQLSGREMAGLPAGRTAQERVMDVVRTDVERAAGVLTGWLAEAPAAAKGAK